LKLRAKKQKYLKFVFVPNKQILSAIQQSLTRTEQTLSSISSELIQVQINRSVSVC